MLAALFVTVPRKVIAVRLLDHPGLSLGALNTSTIPFVELNAARRWVTAVELRRSGFCRSQCSNLRPMNQSHWPSACPRPSLPWYQALFRANER